MLNIAAIMGRLVSDPELKHTPNDIAVTTFTLAVDRNYSKGEKQTDFIDVVAWRGTAEFVCKYFSKGRMIAVDGSIQTRSYEDKNGNKRKAFEIVANNVSFADSKRDDTDQSNKDRQAQTYQSKPDITSDDDLDFEDLLNDPCPF